MIMAFGFAALIVGTTFIGALGAGIMRDGSPFTREFWTSGVNE